MKNNIWKRREGKITEFSRRLDHVKSLLTDNQKALEIAERFQVKWERMLRKRKREDTVCVTCILACLICLVTLVVGAIMIDSDSAYIRNIAIPIGIAFIILYIIYGATEINIEAFNTREINFDDAELSYVNCCLEEQCKKRISNYPLDIHEGTQFVMINGKIIEIVGCKAITEQEKYDYEYQLYSLYQFNRKLGITYDMVGHVACKEPPHAVSG